MSCRKRKMYLLATTIIPLAGNHLTPIYTTAETKTLHYLHSTVGKHRTDTHIHVHVHVCTHTHAQTYSVHLNSHTHNAHSHTLTINSAFILIKTFETTRLVYTLYMYIQVCLYCCRRHHTVHCKHAIIIY